MSRDSVISCITNLALAVAIFLFLYTRPFTDLLPFLIAHHSLPALPPIVPPTLLFTAFVLWLWFRTEGRHLLFVAGVIAFLPILLTLSAPVISDILFDTQWLILSCVLFLLSPVFISWVSPRMQGVTKARKVLFIITAWLLSFSFMFLMFLLMMRANAVPVSATFALVTGLSVLSYSLSGGRFGITSRLLMMVGALPLFLVLVQMLLDGNARTPRDEEEPLRKAGLITAGPYLQNMQKNSMMIMWETTAPLSGKVIVSPWKEALLSPEIEQGNSPAEGQCITVESPNATIHKIIVNHLAENTHYYYRVVSNGVGLGIGSFRTAYEGSEPFDFAVYGDSQEMFGWAEYLVRNKHKEVCNSILANSPQARFIVHVGDMTFLGNEHERWIREFFGRAAGLIRNTVVWPVIGNHELNAPWYFDYFSVPNADEHYYSFDYGNCRFIVLAVEGYAVGHEYGPPTRTPMEPGSPQYEWLKKTLENSQDKTWRFVFFHQSPFASGIEGGYTPASTIFVPLFEQYHVNAVFSGHDHVHEVSIKDNIVYIVTGGGGGPVFSLQPDLRHNPYSCYFKATWHHCNVHVTTEGFEVDAIDLKGRVFHSVKVNGSHTPHIMLKE